MTDDGPALAEIRRELAEVKVMLATALDRLDALSQWDVDKADLVRTECEGCSRKLPLRRTRFLQSGHGPRWLCRPCYQAAGG